MSANGMAPAALRVLSAELQLGRRKAKLKEHAVRTSQNTLETIGTIGIDVGKNTFHLVGLDKRGAIVLQQKVTRHQLAPILSGASLRPRCASDPRAVRKTVPPGTQND
jgi:hypothetical protein